MVLKRKIDWQIAACGFFGAVFGGIVGGRWLSDGWWGYGTQALCGAGSAVAAFVVVRAWACLRTQPAVR